jgi:hypothetical protein
MMFVRMVLSNVNVNVNVNSFGRYMNMNIAYITIPFQLIYNLDTILGLSSLRVLRVPPSEEINSLAFSNVFPSFMTST